MGNRDCSSPSPLPVAATIAAMAHTTCSTMLALAGLALTMGCATSPEGNAADHAVGSAVSALATREALPVVAVVGGVRQAGVRHEDLSAGHRDILAEQLARALERTLTQENVRVVSHRDMPLAMDVLRLQVSDMFPAENPGDEAALGRFHQADALVTAEYIPDDDGNYLLEIQVIDVHTLEILALGHGHSRTALHRGWDHTLTGAAVITVPLPLVWDMLSYSAERSWGDETMGGWEVFGGLFLFPIHLASSPFLAGWDSTAYWLDLDDS
ncbi:MAG: hypothetical protein ACI9EF_000650 [Pseudohongiellaceae bacterium]|jgi:hypothetical protein